MTRMERPHTGTLETGQAVLSLAGRDAGRVMVVLEADEEGFVLAADGRRRKLASPKRKRVKHLRGLGKVLEPEEYATDRRLRRALSRLEEPERG